MSGILGFSSPPAIAGQMGRGPVLGFRGTSLTPVVSGNDAPVFYVNAGHALASDDSDGTNPAEPLATLQSLITRTVAFNAGTGTRQPIIEDFSTIYVNDHFTEAVSIVDWSTMGSYVNLIGAGPGMFAPTWESGAAGTPCFVAGAIGWRISGFRFAAPSAAAALLIPSLTAPYLLGSGIRTLVHDNYFDGTINGGLYGIDLHGAPYNCIISNNIFGFMTAVGGLGIASTNTGLADAFRTIIDGNWFHESVGGINASLNVSIVTNNVFSIGGSIPMVLPLDLRTGTLGENIVSGNTFGAANYSNVGGFWANAANPGGWAGNTSEDVAEAEVADNGWTILPPA